MTLNPATTMPFQPTFREGQRVVEKVPEAAANQADVGLHDDKPATRPQRHQELASASNSASGPRNVLKDIAGEGHVDGPRRDGLTKPCQRQHMRLDPLGGEAEDFRVGVDGDPTRRAEVVDQLAVAGSGVEDRRLRRDVAGKEGIA